MQPMGISRRNEIKECIYPLNKFSHQYATLQPSTQSLSPSQHLDVKAGNQAPSKTLGVKHQVGFKQTPRIFKAYQFLICKITRERKVDY